ncbi:MAG TPA: ferrous iron transporter B [Halanaerobiaceae bacterium]|nr:ferrous iron transporter B [Bacillota bacterium]HHU91833.1 ferrous iron transporter B [Halanaerobiaceae bacterium]
MRVLLMGNPNVGKSVIFSELTGITAMSANYPGTTVTYSQGHFEIDGLKLSLVDVPGTYALDMGTEAEVIANEFLEEGADAIVVVLDATNLERNLYLALQVIDRGFPTVVALNLVDVAKSKGIKIDLKALEKELGVPVVATTAVKAQGIEDLKKTVLANLGKKNTSSKEWWKRDYWQAAELIAGKTQTFEEGQKTLGDRLDEKMMQPLAGSLIAIAVTLLSFAGIVGVGMGVRKFLLRPLFDNFIEPVIRAIVISIVPNGVLQNILIGDYGFLIKTIEWPLTLMLPYVVSFYIVLALLEDSGYMPRLAALLDSIFKKIGLQGAAMIPFILGYGCAIPAIMGTRSLSDRRERKVVSTLIAIGVPCISQTGAFISLLGARSFFLVIALYLLSLAAIFITGRIFMRFSPEPPEPLAMELPPLLWPEFRTVSRRTWYRLKSTINDALVPLTIVVAITAILYETGGLHYIGNLLSPLVVKWLGLPAEASVGLIAGIVRRELAVLPLLDMNLTTGQLFVGAIVALFYMPCAAVFGVLASEFSVKEAIGVGLITIFLAFTIGGVFNHLFKLIAFIF